MKYLSVLSISALIIGFGVTYLNISKGDSPFIRASLLETALVFGLALVVFILSLIVLAYKKGKLPSLNGINAYNIFLLGQFSIFSAVILIMLYGGVILGQFEIWGIVFKHFMAEIWLLISLIILLLAGFFNYFCCRVDKNDDNSTASQSGA